MTGRLIGARAPLPPAKKPGEIRTGRVPIGAVDLGAVPLPDGAFRLCGIDVGLARCSVAWFELRPESRGRWYAATLDQKAGAYRGGWWIATPPDMPFEQRLAAIGRALSGELRRTRVGHVFVERPQAAGTYQRHKDEVGADVAQAFGGRIQKSIADLFSALGVVCAVAAEYAAQREAGISVVPPTTLGGRKKEDRLAFVRMILRSRPNRGLVELANDNDADAVGVALGQPWDF